MGMYGYVGVFHNSLLIEMRFLQMKKKNKKSLGRSSKKPIHTHTYPYMIPQGLMIKYLILAVLTN